MDYTVFDELAPTTPAPAVASTSAPDLLDQTPSPSYVHDRSRLNLGPPAHDPFRSIFPDPEDELVPDDSDDPEVMPPLEDMSYTYTTPVPPITSPPQVEA